MSDPHSILRPPYRTSFQLDNSLKSKIAQYLGLVINKPFSKVQRRLPKAMPTWGKVRIAGSGDSIQAASTKYREGGRNMSYVRVRT